MPPTSHAPKPRYERYIIWRPTPTHRAHVTNGYRGRRPGTVKAVCGFEGLLLGGAISAKPRHICKMCLGTMERTGVPVEGLIRQ